MIAIIGVLSIVVVYLSYKCYEHYKEKDIFKKVKWCVSHDPSSYCNNIDVKYKLRGYILHLQEELALEKKYNVAEAEFNIVSDIIQGYQKDLIQKYFRGYATNSNAQSEEAYFIYTFLDFLERHQHEDTFNGSEMYIQERKLTDYAVVYYKLLYVTQLQFLKLNNITEPGKLGVIRAEGTKKAIDTRELDDN